MSERHSKFNKVGENLNLFSKLDSNRKIHTMVIHHSGTMDSMSVGARNIDEWHRERWGNDSGCGYHYVIRRSGAIEIGRDINFAGAHAKGKNRNSVGICLEGGKIDPKKKSTGKFTFQQSAKLLFLTRWLNKELGGKVKVLGHSEIRGASTLCPNLSMIKLRKNILLQDML